MRPLTPSEIEMLDRRRAGFDEFLAERMPVLAEFMQVLQFPNPALVLVEAEKYLAGLDQWVSLQVIGSEDDRIWLLTRLGYFVGEYLVQGLNGCWIFNENPESQTFGRYVVGQFSKIRNRNAMVDPFMVADMCIAEPPGRSLQNLLDEAEEELAQA